MSDRSAFQLIVYACPDKQREALLKVLRYEGLSEDWTDPVGETLLLAVQYTAEEKTLDAYESIANRVIAVAPGAAFLCWNDPKYEYPGAITMYEPTLGRFTGECDQSGDPYLTAGAFRSINFDGDDPIGEIENLLGMPWLDLFENLKGAESAR